MRTLTKLLLVVSSLISSITLISCDEGIVDHLYDNYSIIINATNSPISFLSDSCGVYVINSNDTIYCDDIYDCAIFKTMYGGNPKLQIGNDSIISLFNSNYACWPYNCQNTQLGEYEWLHTYIIDDQWIKDAWIESTTGECPLNAKYTLYD